MKNITMLLTAIICLNIPPLRAQTKREFHRDRARLKIERKERKKLERAGRESGPPMLFSNKAGIYVTPTSLLSPYGALIPLGVTWYFAKRFSFSFDAAIPLKFTIKTWNTYDKSIKSDLALRSDLKMYINIGHTHRYFIGLESMYREQHFTTPKYGSLYYPGGFWYRTGPLDMHKRSISFAGLFGGEIKLASRFLLEGKIGFGIRFIRMQHNFMPHGLVYSEEFHKLIGISNEDEIGDKDYVIYAPMGLGIKYILK